MKNDVTSQTELEEAIKQLVVARLAVLSPETGLSIGSEGSFSRDELIEHVELGDEIGKMVTEVQMEGLRYWKEMAGI
ncbi:MAG: hypothetical protein WC477_06455 [Patescibacteria group bacterium]